MPWSSPDSEQPEGEAPAVDWRTLSEAELVATIKEMGIVGMGGATFPAHVKLTIPRDKKIDAFIINGVECEPYLTADYRVMMERADEALQGALICAKATRAPGHRRCRVE